MVIRGGIQRFWAPQKYDGKVDFDADVHRFDYVGILNKRTEVYTKIVYAKFLKRTIRVVMFKSIKNGKKGHALLYSKDTELDAMTLVEY
ncbi:hypothetical protein BTJ40_04955 [Microbulbifer sp. A4B17]|nr:hypothetical protein BTJ40_04955 [Microbulbifer sp. A4B17]